MKRFLILFLLSFTHFTQSVFSQCDVQVFSSAIDIVCGDEVRLNAIGEGITVFDNDFNDCSIGTGWAATAAADFTRPCLPTPDGSCYLWMGEAATAPRNATTNPMDLTTGGNINFGMRYAVQGDASPCEGIDLPDEGVSLQFSNPAFNGGNWTTISYYDPRGGNDAFRTNWNQYNERIPNDAMGPNIQLRWIQLAASGGTNDHWGLEDIEVVVNPPGVQYTWQHTGITKSNGNTPPIYPTASGTYTCDYVFGSCVTSASVDITVRKLTVNAFANPNTPICPGDEVQLDAEVSENLPPQVCGISTTGCVGNIDTVKIGTNNSANTGYYFIGKPNGGGSCINGGGPGGTQPGWHNGRRLQVIYRASDFPAFFTGGQIYNMSLNAMNVVEGRTKNFTIKIGCTIKESFTNGSDWADPTGLVTVIDDVDYTFVAGANIFDFDQAFDWDGISNIVVQYCFNAGSGANIPSVTGSVRKTDVGYNAVCHIGSCGKQPCDFTSPGTGGVNSFRPDTEFGICYRPPANIDYTWTPDNWLDDNTLKSPKATPENPTTYTVTAWDKNTPLECAVSDDISIEMQPSSNFVSTGDTVCLGDDATISTGSSSFPVNWTGPNGFTSTEHNPVILNTTEDDEGWYTFTGDDLGSCGEITKTVWLEVVEPPFAGIPTPIAVCSTSPAFDINDQLENEDADGIWTDENTSDGFLSPPLFDPSAVVLSLPTAVNMKYEINGGVCPAASSIVPVTINKEPFIGEVKDTTICNLECSFDLYSCFTVQADAGGLWDDFDGTGSVVNTGEINPCNLVAGTYTFTYRLNGEDPCPDAEISFNVTIEEAQNPGIPTDISVCYSSPSFNLFDQLAGEDGSGTWQDVSNSNGLVNPSTFNPALTAPPNVYELTYTVTGVVCPSLSASVFVTVNTSPTAGASNDTIFCNTTQTIDLLTLLKGKPDNTGDWMDEFGKPTSQNQNISTLSPGNHCFTYTVPAESPCPEPSAVVCILVEKQPNAGIAEPVSSCINNMINLEGNLAGQDANGIWEDFSITPNTGLTLNVSELTIANDNTIQGDFTYIYSIQADSVCLADTAFMPVAINNIPEIINETVNCAPDELSYTVEFDLQYGDNSSYNILDNPNSGTGTLTGGHYTYTGVPTGSAIDFTVSDANNCGTNQISILKFCDCLTEAGTMANTVHTLKVCLNNPAIATYYTGFINDGNDSLSYVLHEGNSTVLVNVWGRNTNPSFTFQNGMVEGKTYYISAIAGNGKADGLADETDGCLSVSVGVPVIFYAYPDANFALDKNSICPGEKVARNITITKGIAPFRIVLDGNSSLVPALGLVSDTVTPVLTSTFTLDSIIDANGCGVELLKQASVNVTSAPVAQITGSLQGCSDNAPSFEVTLSGDGTVFNFSYTNNFTNDTVYKTNQAKGTVQVTPTISNANGIVSYTLVSVSDNSGAVCPGAVSGSYNLFPTPTTTLSSNTQSYCPNDLVVLSLNLTGIGPWEIILANNDIVFDTIIATANNYTKTYPSFSFTSDTHNISVIKLTDLEPSGPTCNNTTLANSTLTTFIVEDAPQVLVNATSQDFCVGASLTYTLSMLSGSTGNYAITYSITDTSVTPNNTILTKTITLTSSGTQNETLTLSNAGAYKIEINNVVGTSSSACSGFGLPFIFTVHPTPQVLTSTLDTSICLGNVLNIPFTTLGTVNPSNLTFVVDTNGVSETYDNTLANIKLPSSIAGNFTYQVHSIIDGSLASCTGNDFTIDVSVLPSPSINFNTSINSDSVFEFCFGSPIHTKFNLFTANSTKVDFVGLSRDTIVGAGTVSTFKLPTLSDTTLIQVNLLDMNIGCTGYGEFTVIVHPLPDIDIPDMSLCENTKDTSLFIVTLGGNGPFNIKFVDIATGLVFNDTTTSTFGDSSVISVDNFTQDEYANFWVQAYDTSLTENGNTCFNQWLKTQTINPQPSAAINIDPKICNGELANITVTLSGSTSGSNYNYYISEKKETTLLSSELKTGNDGDNFSSTSPSLNLGEGSTSFTYEIFDVFDGNNCPAIITKPIAKIEVNPNPTASFIPSTLGSCSPVNIDFQSNSIANGGVPISSWNWDLGSTSRAGVNELNFTFTNKSSSDVSYAVTLKVINEKGCIDDTTINVTAFHNADPYFTQDNFDITVVKNQVFLRNTDSYLPGNFYWTIDGDTVDNTNLSAVIQFNRTPNKSYTVCLDASTANGCSGVYCKDFTVKDTEVIYIPNSFSPNVDGLNEVFKPVIISGLDSNSYNFAIFDRWGKVIFETTNIDEGWDGKGNNNQVLPVGVYIFNVTGLSTIKPVVQINKKGHINLVR